MKGALNMEELRKLYEFCDSHKWLVRIVATTIWLLHMTLNIAYLNKPVPISGIVLQPWMAVVNTFTAGILAGFVVGMTNVKR